MEFTLIKASRYHYVGKFNVEQQRRPCLTAYSRISIAAIGRLTTLFGATS